MSKDASFMISFGMLLICIQVKQKSFITAHVIGTILICIQVKQKSFITAHVIGTIGTIQLTLIGFTLYCNSYVKVNRK